MPELIRGVVLGAGVAVPWAAVSLTSAPADVADIAALTDDDGRFVLSVPAGGRYRIRVEAEGWLPDEVELVVGAATADELTIDLQAE